MSRPEPLPFVPEPLTFAPDWPAPDRRLLEPARPAAPPPPLEAVLSPSWAAWVRGAAEAKAAPPDYVLAALLATCGTLIGNSRWAAPWSGWAEPPILWATLIGSPSMNKSPALDAVLGPLRAVERDLQERAKAELADWRAKAEVAKLAESAWKEEVKVALKAGEDPPPGPRALIPVPSRFCPASRSRTPPLRSSRSSSPASRAARFWRATSSPAGFRA